MKKRNWLMTIAFAVLSLTIVSTMVIGTTYAKFVSQVNSTGSAQAAGFLVAGTVATTQINTIMAPGVTADQTVSLKYFSQVDTQITALSNDASLAATGVFDETTWNALVTFYNSNWQKIGNALGYGVYASGTPDTLTLNTGYHGAAVAANLDQTALLTVTAGEGGNTVAQEFIAQVFTNNANKTAAYGSTAALKTTTTTNDTIPAMLPAYDSVLTANLDISVAWTTQKYQTTSANDTDNDLFDTFIGDCIAALATGQDLIYNYYATSSAPTTTALYVIGVDGEINGETSNGVTFPIDAPVTTGANPTREKVTSTIGIAIGLKAEQVIES